MWEAAGHDKNFKPARHFRSDIHKTPYEHIDEPPAKKKNYRDEDGAVIVENRNFVTNPMKRGKVGRATSFGGIIPYTEDDYDIKKKIA